LTRRLNGTGAESSWLIASGDNSNRDGIKTIEISPELNGYEKDIQGIINLTFRTLPLESSKSFL
jgi:hypothetical protein